MATGMGHIEQERRGDMIYRKLAGVSVSVIGLGGSHFAKCGDEQECSICRWRH